MATQKGDRWYPDYVNIGYRKIKLDPAKTPMENLWEVIRITCSIWLAKFRVYAYSREAIEELEQEFQLRTFLRLRDHVWKGTYRKDLSLYLNVRSAAWGCCSDTIRIWKQRNITIPNSTVSLDTPVKDQNPDGGNLTIGDSIASHEVPRLRTRYDITKNCEARCNKRLTLDDVEFGTSGYPQVWRAVTEAEWDYYLQSCSEFGLEPISKEEFLEKNFPPPGKTKSERALHKAEVAHNYWLKIKKDPVWRAKHRAWERLRYHRNKEKKKEQG